MKEELSLFELNEFIRRFVALNVPDSIWITAEISQANLNKGHYYIDLIQKARDSEQIVAQSYAVLWAKTLGRIAASKTSNITQILKQGLKVKLRVQVDFHEKWGLKLVIEDIDENFTYGNLALERAKIIKRLQAEKLMERNRQVPLPRMIKRVAVLSSRTAAGYKDFVKHLTSNEYGYTFAIQLFPIRVQGMHVEEDFLDQIKKIDWTKFDLIAVIRGGGSKIDLAAFDSYEICKTIATCPTPIITGIGHEIDETIADMVSHTSVKTPTAVASYIINKNLEFESHVTQLNQAIGQLVARSIQGALVDLQRNRSELSFLADRSLQTAHKKLETLSQQIDLIAQNKLKGAKIQLEHWQQTVTFLSVENTLKRGFTVTYNQEGKAVDNAKELKKGDIITTHFKKGKHNSKIQ